MTKAYLVDKRRWKITDRCIVLDGTSSNVKNIQGQFVYLMSFKRLYIKIMLDYTFKREVAKQSLSLPRYSEVLRYNGWDVICSGCPWFVPSV